MTIAEMLIKQGRQEGIQEGVQEGIQEGRLETLETLARSGVAWPIIESAAGGDPDTLQALKQRLAASGATTDSQANGGVQPDPPP